MVIFYLKTNTVGNIVVVLIIGIFVAGIIGLLIENSHKKFLSEKEIELNVEKSKLLEVRSKLIEAKRLMSVFNIGSKTKEQIDNYNNVALPKFKSMYEDYLVTLKVYNEKVKMIQSQIKEKGLFCSFCQEEQQEFNLTFDF
jgi:hypothetical protein